MVTTAQYGLIILLICSMILHILVVLKVLPYKMLWGGRISTDAQMYRLETISLLTNLVFLVAILSQLELVDVHISHTWMKILMWIMVVAFTMNTFGNASSKNQLEKFLFTPLTFIMAIFSLILALQL